MNQKIWPSLILALVTLAMALFVGLNEPKDSREGLAWASFESPQIRAVRLKTSQRSVELTPLGVGVGWVKLDDAGKESATPSSQQFLVGDGVRDILFSLSPLWANRVLGIPPEKSLKDYGFANPTGMRILTIDLLGGGSREFQIGLRGFQSFDYFVRDPSNKKVFLWSRETIDQLSDPSRMALKDLRFLRLEDLASLEVVSSGTAGHQFRITKTQRVWKDGPKPLVAEDPRLVWMEKLAKVGIHSYRKKTGVSNETLLEIKAEAESSWRLRILWDENLKTYILDLGDDRPDILLDTTSFAPLYEEWKSGKVVSHSE